MTKKLLNSIDVVTNTLASQQLPGDDLLVINTPQFSIAMDKRTVNDFAELGKKSLSSGAEVELPSMSSILQLQNVTTLSTKVS